MCVWNRTLLQQGGGRQAGGNAWGPLRWLLLQGNNHGLATHTVVEDTEMEASKIKEAADGLVAWGRRWLEDGPEPGA